MKRITALIIALLAISFIGKAEIGDKIELDGLCYEIAEVENLYPNEPPYLWALTDKLVAAKIYAVTHIPENGIVNVPKTITINGTDYDVAFIGESAFEGHTELKEFNLSTNQCTIFAKAFKDCGDMTLNISGVIRAIHAYAFSGTNVANGLDLSNAIRVEISALEGTKTKTCILGSYLWSFSEHIFDNSDIEEVSFVDNECKYEYEVRANFATFAFNECKLKEIRFPKRHIGLATVVFMNCMNLERVIFPDYPEIWPLVCTDFLDGAETPPYPFGYNGCIIYQCPNLKEVVSLNPQPTLLMFQNVLNTTRSILDDHSTCVLKVPAGSEDAYRADPVWGKFQHIEGFQPGEYAGVESVGTTAQSVPEHTSLKMTVGSDGLTQELLEGEVEIFTATGQKLHSVNHPGGTFHIDLPSGFYIIHLK